MSGDYFMQKRTTSNIILLCGCSHYSVGKSVARKVNSSLQTALRAHNMRAQHYSRVDFEIVILLWRILQNRYVVCVHFNHARIRKKKMCSFVMRMNLIIKRILLFLHRANYWPNMYCNTATADTRKHTTDRKRSSIFRISATGLRLIVMNDHQNDDGKKCNGINNK